MESISIKSQSLLWNEDNDVQFYDPVPIHGIDSWSTVSMALNIESTLKPKMPKSWKENVESPNTKKDWSVQDELRMIIAHKEHKNHWSNISEFVRGKNNNTIKNKFYSVFRKIRGKVMKSDYSYNSRLELLEIHYIISLIEDCLEHPPLTPKVKGKRGKDFTYSLICGLTKESVANYKARIHELFKDKGTMEELFAELSATVKGTKEPTYAKSKHNEIKEISKPKYHVNPIIIDEESFSEFSNFEMNDNPRILDDKFAPLPFTPEPLSAGPSAIASYYATCFHEISARHANLECNETQQWL